jgi:hypothetical protein
VPRPEGAPAPVLRRSPVAATGGPPKECWRGTGGPRGSGSPPCCPSCCHRGSTGGVLEDALLARLRAAAVPDVPRSCNASVVAGASVSGVGPAGSQWDGFLRGRGGRSGVGGGRRPGRRRGRPTGRRGHVRRCGVVELDGQLGQGLRPVASGERLGCGDLDSPFDDLYRRPAGGCGAVLLPGAVAAGDRTPFGYRSPGSRRDRPAAPAAGRRGGPPLGDTCGLRRVRADLRRLRSQGLLATLPLALSSPVLGGAAVSHARDDADDPPVTRHHELWGLRGA